MTPTDRRAEVIGRIVLMLPTLSTDALEGLHAGLTDSRLSDAPPLRVTTDPTPTEPARQRARPAPPNPLTPENVTLLGAEKTDAIRRVIAAMPAFDVATLRQLADRLESRLLGNTAPDSMPALRLSRDSTEGGTMTATEFDTWRVALHEAGHAVAARALGAGGWGTIAVLLPDGGGFATRHTATPRIVAVIAAAGPAAEPLADRHAPPVDVAADDAEPGTGDAVVFPFRAEPELTAGFEATHADSVSDDSTIATYVYHPRTDGLWADRHDLTHNLAREIVRRFEPTIVTIARELFRRRVLLPSVLDDLLRPIPIGLDIGADLIERKLDMIDVLVDQIDSTEAAAKQAFTELVRDIAAGVSPDPERAAATLRAAGKSTADLRDAVARWSERLRLYDVTCSAAQGLGDERVAVREKIGKADAELERARLKHLETVAPLARRIREIDAVESRADDARLALIRGCDDARREVYEDAAHRHAVADARVSELRRLVMRGRHRDPADRGPDAERERACGRTAAAELPEAEREAARLLAERDRAESECAKP